jgi:UDP-GlcNAc:undecaprenyl-phosphate GlcNAc-1-phosphate transferase
MEAAKTLSPLATSLLNAFLLAVVTILISGSRAVRIGLMDIPKGRKTHDGAVPLTGGIAMFAGFLIPAVILSSSYDIHWGLVFGLMMLVGLGVADDIWDLAPRTKLCGQVVAALTMALAGGMLIGPGSLFGDAVAGSPWVTVPFTVFFVVGVINAFNMIDGLDGLAGGVAATALFWIVAAAWLGGVDGAAVEPLLVLCATLGFLVFNIRHPWRKRAAVFMGDAGSMMLGGAIAFFAIGLAKGGAGGAHPPLPAILWFFALPVFDTVSLIGRRLAAGASPLVGDRRHMHHLLLEAGLRLEQATGVLIVASGLLGAVGFAGWRLGLPPIVLTIGLLVPFALHLSFVCFGWKALQRRIGGRRAKTTAPTPVPTPAPAAKVIRVAVAAPAPAFQPEAFQRIEIKDPAA